MSLQPMFDFLPEDLPHRNFIASNFSDTDSLFVNDGYSDTEEDDTYEDSRMDGQESPLSVVRTGDKDDYTQETRPSAALSPETYDGQSSYDFESTQIHIERILSRLPTTLSEFDTQYDSPATALLSDPQFKKEVEILKRKREEAMERLRSIKAKMDYHEMVLAQTMLGVDGDESMSPMDMFDAEHQHEYLEEEMSYDDADADMPDLVGINHSSPPTAEATPQTDDSEDGESKKVDKGKGKAIDKGKEKARDKGKGRARVSPYGLIPGRFHREGDVQIPRLGMGRSSRLDWLSNTLHRPSPFDDLYEGRSEFAHFSRLPRIGPYGYGGIPAAGGSEYNGTPIASGSGTRRDD